VKFQVLFASRPGIDTRELRKQGAAIKTRIENIIQSSKEEQTQTQTSVRNGVMYG
jgi:predicted ATP-grasp superfamily ATP-dependent carboligase